MQIVFVFAHVLLLLVGIANTLSIPVGESLSDRTLIAQRKTLDQGGVCPKWPNGYKLYSGEDLSELGLGGTGKATRGTPENGQSSSQGPQPKKKVKMAFYYSRSSIPGNYTDVQGKAKTLGKNCRRLYFTFGNHVRLGKPLDFGEEEPDAEKFTRFAFQLGDAKEVFIQSDNVKKTSRIERVVKRAAKLAGVKNLQIYTVTGKPPPGLKTDLGDSSPTAKFRGQK